MQQAASGPSNAQSLPFSSTTRVLVFIFSQSPSFGVVLSAGDALALPSVVNQLISAKKMRKFSAIMPLKHDTLIVKQIKLFFKILVKT